MANVLKFVSTAWLGALWIDGEVFAVDACCSTASLCVAVESDAGGGFVFGALLAVFVVVVVDVDVGGSCGLLSTVMKLLCVTVGVDEVVACGSVVANARSSSVVIVFGLGRLSTGCNVFEV